jgi:AbrB family looped-hinge helix DNA binding protein
MAEVTLSSRNPIVVPREAREALGLHAGDKIIIAVRGGTVVMLPHPASWTTALRGLAREGYPKNYVQEERASWDEELP